MNTLPAAYQISGEIAEILARLEVEEVEFDDVEERLDELDQALQQKGVGVSKYILMLKDLAQGIRLREIALAEHRKAVERRAQWLADYLQRNMEAARITEITDTRSGTEIKLVKNPPRVEVDDENAIPERFWEIIETVKIDKIAIAKELKAGRDVPGTHLEQSTRARIT